MSNDGTAEVLDTMVGLLAKAIRALLAAGIIAMVVLNFSNVVARYVFGKSMLGADELQQLLLVWAVFLGAVIATQRDEHIRMDVLFMALPLAIGRVVRAIEALLAVGLFAFMTWVSGQYFVRMVALNNVSEATGLPTSYLHLAGAVGFALMTVIAVIRLIQIFTGRYRINRSPSLT